MIDKIILQIAIQYNATILQVAIWWFVNSKFDEQNLFLTLS